MTGNLLVSLGDEVRRNEKRKAFQHLLYILDRIEQPTILNDDIVVHFWFAECLVVQRFSNQTRGARRAHFYQLRSLAYHRQVFRSVLFGVSIGTPLWNIQLVALPFM